MVKHLLQTAWRNFLRQKGNSFINIAGLSIGMAAALLIFIWVKNELTFDDFHMDHKRIFRIKDYLTVDKRETLTFEYSPYLLAEYARQLPEVLQACRIRPIDYDALYFNVNGRLIREKGCAYIDSGWLNMFKYEFIYGNKANFNAHPFSLLLTASNAKKYFGGQDPIGKIIRIDTISYTVQGVIKDQPANSIFQYDAYIPAAARLQDPKNKTTDESWGNFFYITFLKLAPTGDPNGVAEKLKQITAVQSGNDKFKLGLTPLNDLRLENDIPDTVLPHGNKKVVYIFTVLGILLLLIACINYVTLTTANATLRVKEVSIKKILGADKRQLFAQFIAESALISLFALAFTLIIVKLAFPFFNRFTEEPLPFASSGIWLISVCTLLLTTILNSIYPAVLLSSFKPLSIFKGKNALQIKDIFFRKGLVITQLTFSIVLIVATIVVYRQLVFIDNQNSNYNRSQLMSFTIPWKLLRNKEMDQRMRLTGAIKQALLSSSFIDDVSLMDRESVINMQGYSSGGSTDWNGRQKDFKPAIAFYHADTSFKKIINLQMSEGRWFQTGNLADRKNSILNETAVRELHIHQPVIGQRFVSQGDTGVIIGVVKDFYYKSLHEKIGPVVFGGVNEYSNTYLVKTNPGKIRSATEAAENVWKRFFPNEPFAFSFLNEEFDNLYRTDRKISLLIWIFSCIAVFISCLGLFGLSAFTAGRKKKEISIRKVLGAGLPNIMILLSKEFIYMVLIAMIIAFPIALWTMHKWLESFVYRIKLELWIFLTAGILALAIALLTVSYQVIKAGINNPLDNLRTEN